MTTQVLAQVPTTGGKRLKRSLRRAKQSVRRVLIEAPPPWLQRLLGPVAMRVDMLLVDHGIFRLAYLNRHALGSGAWRSAQPNPRQIGDLVRRLGLRTIINLRGERQCGSYWLERATRQRLGVCMVDFSLGSREAPSRQMLAATRDLLANVKHPVLMHCKSGADRAGLMGVLYRHVVQGEPIDAARRELSWRYGHFRSAKTGVLDAVFERYLADAAREPMPFYAWVATHYDPAALTREFRTKRWADRVVDGLLRRE